MLQIQSGLELLQQQLWELWQSWDMIPLRFSIARGLIEAIGCGMKIMPGDVAFRGNWATLDDEGMIVDRRAGRIREGTKELSSSLCGLKIDDVSLYVGSGTEHRVALVIRGVWAWRLPFRK